MTSAIGQSFFSPCRPSSARFPSSGWRRRRSVSPLPSAPPRHGAGGATGTAPVDLRRRQEHHEQRVAHLLLSLSATAALTLAYYWLGVTNPTTIALSMLLVVLVVATLSHRWVAVATSLAAFFCFNFFFLPPVGTLRIDGSAELVALFSLLTVSLVASHLSAEARRRTEEATARRKEAELERRSAELKSALLAALGHDLKTPLTAVTVAADNLTATWLDQDGRREQAEIVRSELQKLNRLFEDITDMARIETHAVDAEPEWVHPAEIVEAAARQVEAEIGRASCRERV